MGRSSEGARKRASSRSRSPARKSVPSGTTTSSAKRGAASRSRSRTPTRAAASKAKGTVVHRKRSPSPSPVRKKTGPKPKPRPVSKSPIRQTSTRRKKQSPDRKASPARSVETSLVSSAGVTPPRSKGAGQQANGLLSFSQMISTSKSKGVKYLSELFSSPSPRKSQQQPSFCGRMCQQMPRLPSFKFWGQSRPRSLSPVRGSFANALAKSSPGRTRSSSRRRWISSASCALFYLALLALVFLVAYIAYVQREILAARVGYGAKYAQQTYSSLGQQIADVYQKWKK